MNSLEQTIEGFKKDISYDQYNTLIVLIIAKKRKNYRTDFNTLFSGNKNCNIIDIYDIIKKFSGNNFTAKKLEPIVDFLESELDFKINPKRSKSNEVITIIKMIEYLSDDNNYKETSINEIADPDKKRLRFVEYFDFLMERYSKLLPIYTGTLSQAKETSGIDGVRVAKINVYLQSLSDTHLIKNANNPKEALYELIDYFETEISSSNIDYDRVAIEFYLLDELINCNVFPNPIE